jgi:hypothetical protein
VVGTRLRVCACCRSLATLWSVHFRGAPVPWIYAPPPLPLDFSEVPPSLGYKPPPPFPWTCCNASRKKPPTFFVCFWLGRGCAVGTAELLVALCAPHPVPPLSLGGPSAGGRPALLPIVPRVKARTWICRLPFPGVLWGPLGPKAGFAMPEVQRVCAVQQPPQSGLLDQSIAFFSPMGIFLVCWGGGGG